MDCPGTGPAVEQRLSLLALLAGTALLLVGLARLRSALGSNGGPEPVEALVTTSGVAAMNREIDLYYPEVTFEYRYDGRTYRSSFVEPATERLGRDYEVAREICSQYPRGERVTAYVPSDDPGSAYLEPEDGAENDARPIGPLLVVLTGLALLAAGGCYSYSMVAGGLWVTS